MLFYLVSTIKTTCFGTTQIAPSLTVEKSAVTTTHVENLKNNIIKNNFPQHITPLAKDI